MRPCDIERLDGRLLRFFGLLVGFLFLDDWLLFGVLLVGLLLADLLDLLLADLLDWLLYGMLVDLILWGVFIELLLCGFLVKLLLYGLLLCGFLVKLLLYGLLLCFYDWLLVEILLLGWISVDLPLLLGGSMQNGPSVLIEWLLGVRKLLLVGLVSYMLLRSIVACRLMHSKRTASV